MLDQLVAHPLKTRERSVMSHNPGKPFIAKGMQVGLAKIRGDSVWNTANMSEHAARTNLLSDGFEVAIKEGKRRRAILKGLLWLKGAGVPRREAKAPQVEEIELPWVDRLLNQRVARLKEQIIKKD